MSLCPLPDQRLIEEVASTLWRPWSWNLQQNELPLTVCLELRSLYESYSSKQTKLVCRPRFWAWYTVSLLISFKLVTFQNWNLPSWYSIGFLLHNGASHSPMCSWVAKQTETEQALTHQHLRTSLIYWKASTRSSLASEHPESAGISCCWCGFGSTHLSNDIWPRAGLREGFGSSRRVARLAESWATWKIHILW